jgi:hypothetical protein
MCGYVGGVELSASGSVPSNSEPTMGSRSPEASGFLVPKNLASHATFHFVRTRELIVTC